MRIIKSNDGFHRIFQKLKSSNSSLVIWQVNGGKRDICESNLSSYHLDAGTLNFEFGQDRIPLEASLPLYCYAEDGQLIFKTNIQQVQPQNFSAGVPREIKLLEDPEITHIRGQIGLDLSDVWKVKRLSMDPDVIPSDIMRVKSMAERTTRDQDYLNQEFTMSLDEEDKKFADKRESPRARPAEEKKVKICKAGEEGSFFRLFDLSRGGMGFLVNDDTQFPKGTEIHVQGFDEFNLDHPLIGQVVAIRPVDEFQTEFKIGVKFSDGQN